MRTAWPVALLLVAGLAGCLSGDDTPERVSPPDVGYDPTTIRVTGHREEDLTVTSFDGTELAATAYIPLSSDTLPDGSPPEWPVVVFLHGWGLFKEQFEGTHGAVPGASPPEDSDTPEEFSNTLARFADAGFIAVAYDARGFGRSGGQTSIAGVPEMADLDAVLDAVAIRFHESSDRIGLVGVSYGGGQSLLALADNPRIDTAVSMYGWLDLYDALLPGDVPKLEWAQFLFTVGAGGSGGMIHPQVLAWYQQLYTRDALDGLESALDVRSAAGRLPDKPLFVCQGMQESLFPQADRMWQEADARGAFVRAYVYTGGHELMDAGCLDRTEDWMQFWLGGFETGVGSWPALETQDIDGGRSTSFATFPPTEERSYYLRAPDLTGTPNPGVSFDIEQRLASNPFQEPDVLGDLLGPGSAIPEQLRQDPTGTHFATAPLADGGVLIGRPSLQLHLADANQTAWQVVATLYLVDGEGSSRVVSQGALAAVREGAVDEGAATVAMDWTKAEVDPGERLILKIASNDPGRYMPLFEDYTVTFTGDSRLDLPFFAP